MTDDDLKAEFLARNGATKCPDRAAAVLGESVPGWRRKEELRTEKTGKRTGKLQRRLRGKLMSR